jgi:hypothetical protein
MNKVHDQSPDINLMHSMSAVMEMMETRIVERSFVALVVT